jgi:triosephosphate isomerase (TIM)
MRRKLAAGNWKMNGTSENLAEVETLIAAHPAPKVDMVMCPPATLLSRMAGRTGRSPIALGGQDCHASGAGAHTGDISVGMLADAGATHVIVGHSERRADHGESDAQVRAKAEAVIAGGLTAIVCVGETLAQREAGQTLDVVGTQLAGSVPDDAAGASVVVAYEPVWAIGTGKVATPAEIGDVHAFIRSELVKRFGEETGAAIRLLYGGSVKAANAAEIFAVPDVDGALVGGASLTAADFSPIVAALENAIG